MIDMDISCDDCGTSLDDGATVYCKACMDGLIERITELEKELEKAEETIKEMEQHEAVK